MRRRRRRGKRRHIRYGLKQATRCTIKQLGNNPSRENNDLLCRKSVIAQVSGALPPTLSNGELLTERATLAVCITCYAQAVQPEEKGCVRR